MLEAVKNRIYNLIPLAGTPNRAILDVSLSFLALSSFSSFFYSDQGRTMATLATLGLEGRFSGPFAQWIKQTHAKGYVKQAEAKPVYLLVNSQMPDLISKVMAAAAFYFTRDLSFYDSMTNLLSYSEKASKIAQPILDKVASLPVPSLLQATRVIAFAPVIVKLIHMALIWADPKGEYKILDLAKTGANKTSQGLEVLWNLRFSLLCLGISTNIYRSVVSIVYSMLVNRLVSSIRIWLLLRFLPHLLKLLPTPAPSTWNAFLTMFKGGDVWPTTGFSSGLHKTWLSLQSSSAPYDIQVLENLFDEANRLTKSLTGPLDDLKSFQHSIETAQSHISSALEERKISQAHASTLHALLEKKIYEALPDIVLDPQFTSKIEMKDFKQHFIEIYCQQLSTEQTWNFITHLNDINDPSKGIFDIVEMDRIKYSLPSGIREAYTMILFKKFEQVFNNTIIPNLLSDNEFSLPHIHYFLNQFTHAYPEKVKEWRTEIFKKIVGQYPEDLNLETLLDGRLEKNLFNLFGENGEMHVFAVTLQNEYTAYLLSTKFHLKRFELCLKWYLANPPLTSKARKEIEYYLLFLGLQANFDLNYNLISKSTEFASWTINENLTAQNIEEQVEAYIEESDPFDFKSMNLKTPEDFKFETETLPYVIRKIKSLTNTKQDRTTNATLLDPWHELVNFQHDLEEDELQSIFLSRVTMEKDEMEKLLREKLQLYCSVHSFLSINAVANELLEAERKELEELDSLKERVSFFIERFEKENLPRKSMLSQIDRFEKIYLMLQKAALIVPNDLKHSPFKVKRPRTFNASRKSRLKG